jgi:hypothetical protein
MGKVTRTRFPVPLWIRLMIGFCILWAAFIGFIIGRTLR